MSNNNKLPWESDGAAPEGTSAWEIPEWAPAVHDSGEAPDAPPEEDASVVEGAGASEGGMEFPSLLADDDAEGGEAGAPPPPAGEGELGGSQGAGDDAPTEYVSFSHDDTPTGDFHPVGERPAANEDPPSEEAWSNSSWGESDDTRYQAQDYSAASPSEPHPAYSDPAYDQQQYDDEYDEPQEFLGAGVPVDDDVMEDNAVLAEEARANRDKAKYAAIAAAVALVFAVLFGFLWIGERSGNTDLQNEAASNSTTNAQLQDKVGTLAEERDKLLKERDKAREDLNRAREDKGRAEREANDLRDTVDNQNEQIRSLNEANEVIRNELKPKEERIKELDSRIDDLERELREARREQDKPAETKTTTTTTTVIREAPPITETVTEVVPLESEVM